MKQLTVVSDWVDDGVYAAEFESAVSGFLLEMLLPRIIFVKTTGSSIHTGFILEQIIETKERLGRPLNTVIYLGTESKISNQSLSFYVIKLHTGIVVCGLNLDYSFSFIKPKINEAFVYQLNTGKSNFMSRDIYSRVVAHLIESKEQELQLEEVHTNTIAELTGYYAGHIDIFGNIITTIRHEDFKGKYRAGDYVLCTVGEVTRKVVVVDDLWSLGEGILAIGPCSFGAVSNPYLAIASKSTEHSGSARYLFNQPTPGVSIYIK